MLEVLPVVAAVVVAVEIEARDVVADVIGVVGVVVEGGSPAPRELVVKALPLGVRWRLGADRDRGIDIRRLRPR